MNSEENALSKRRSTMEAGLIDYIKLRFDEDRGSNTFSRVMDLFLRMTGLEVVKGKECSREVLAKLDEWWAEMDKKALAWFEGIVHTEPLFVVFDGPPGGPEAPRFVEVETTEGCSVRAGEWVKRHDGYWGLGPFYNESSKEHVMEDCLPVNEDVTCRSCGLSFVASADEPGKCPQCGGARTLTPVADQPVNPTGSSSNAMAAFVKATMMDAEPTHVQQHHGPVYVVSCGMPSSEFSHAIRRVMSSQFGSRVGEWSETNGYWALGPFYIERGFHDGKETGQKEG